MKKISKKYLINQKKNIKDGLIALDKSGIQICLVVDNKSKLVGTLTDGDLRRALIKKFDLNTPLRKVMNKNPFTMPVGTHENKIINVLKKNKLTYIPLMSSDLIAKSLVNLSDFIKTKRFSNYVVIMCGGPGTRLRPYTLNKPKCLLKI